MWVAENSVTHTEKSAINIERDSPSMWMTEFSVTHMFRACITLGFSNSAYM
jgi:hypothetical protein